VRLLLCGVRGSTPATGAEFDRYGGNTSCVAFAHGDADPTLVVDGGTGLRRLSKILDRRAFRGTILLGHLHWDHTHGLPFFASGDQDGARVDVLIPEQGDASEVMARALGPPHFPVRLEDLRGDWSVAGLEPGKHDIEGFRVLARDIPHKMTRTYGFRISDNATSVAYMSDHWPARAPGEVAEFHETARELADGVDLLIHDAQYTQEEFNARAHLGHATIEYAVGLAEACGARELLLFHHDPERTDDEIDALVQKYSTGALPVRAAAEGHVIDL